MTAVQRRLPGQPWTVIASALAAGASYVGTILVTHDSLRLTHRDVGLLLVLIAALAVTYHFPVHVEHRSKIYMGSIVLFLQAALLAPVLAATGAGVGMAVGELTTCRRTGNHLIRPIIPTQVARWVLIALAGSLIAHSTFLPTPLPLLAAGIVLWAGDILTGPILLSPLLDRSAPSVMMMMVREGGAVEAVQYVIGLLGAVAAREQLWLLVLLLPPAALVQTAFRQAHQTSSETRNLLDAMEKVLAEREPELGAHARRTADLARAMLQELGSTGLEVELIVAASRLHDIGVLAISDDRLQTGEGVTTYGPADVGRHSEQGAQLVGTISSFARGAAMIRHHHEAWDGSGYPDGLQATEIPFGARVIAVAEHYDALTHDQPGRPALDPKQAAAHVNNGRATTWDPQVVDALLRVVARDVASDRAPQLRLVRRHDVEEK